MLRMKLFNKWLFLVIMQLDDYLSDVCDYVQTQIWLPQTDREKELMKQAENEKH